MKNQWKRHGMETLDDVMQRLTELKAESIYEHNPFGEAAADREIRAISELLEMFGVKWQYSFIDDRKDGRFIAVLKEEEKQEA